MSLLPPPPVDLATLLGEMAALKAEVRAETRAARDVRDQLATSGETLVRELDAARTREGARSTARQDDQRRDALRLIGLLDRIEALAWAAERAPARGWWRWRRVDPALVAVSEGLELLVVRFEEALAELGVARVATRGATLDPRVMEAVGIVDAGDRPPLAVVEEIGSGWVSAERVVRAAKVVVNAAPGAAPREERGA